MLGDHFSSKASLGTGRGCCGATFWSLRKLPRINLSIYDVPGSKQNIGLGIIPILSRF